MRKLTYSIGAIVLVAAGLFAWSRIALVPIQASTASIVGLSQPAVITANSFAPISPTDMMINHRAEMPVETWDAF
jgi:hypothetical protein